MDKYIWRFQIAKFCLHVLVWPSRKFQWQGDHGCLETCSSWQWIWIQGRNVWQGKTGIIDQLPHLLSCLLRWRLMETMNIQSSNISRSLSPNLLMTLKAWWPTLSSSSGDPSRGLTLHGTLKSSSLVLMELLWKDIPGMYRYWEVKRVFIYIFFRNFLTSDIAADISKAIWGRNGGIAGMEDE